MKKFDTLIQKSSWMKGLAGIAAAIVVICAGSLSCFAAEGKVKAETAKIRSQASTTSEVVGSTVKGKTIDILEAVKDGSGTVWYKVSVANGGFGYIRSDLVETSETIEVSATVAADTGSSGGSKPADTVPTAIGEQQAVVKSPTNVRVRSGASTQHDTLASLPNGTAVTLIGEANDNSGNKWYQITCTYNNKAVEGYVRSDLVEIGGAVENPEGSGETPEGGEGEAPEGGEGENPEGGEGSEGGESSEPESAPAPENNDYEIVYAQDDAGEYTYYLYDNINGTRMKLSEVLNVAGAANESNQKLQDQLDKEKIIIIILAVVIVILFIVLTILLFKIRELYYEDYEDEEEEEEEEEPEPAPVKKRIKKREVEEEEEVPPPVKKKKPAPASQQQERPARSQDREGQQRAGQSRPKADRELHPAQRKEPEKRPAPRKPQNFLVDDDEFEFEFLNMDDKDL